MAAAGSRGRACALLWAHQVLVLDLVVLAFVGASSLLDPAGLARSVQEGAGATAPELGAAASEEPPAGPAVSRLDRDLARSTAPAALALAFLCARSLWRSLGSKRDALVIMVAFHAFNLLVLSLQLWEDLGGSTGATPAELARRLPSSKVAIINLAVGLVVLAGNGLGVAACDYALAKAGSASTDRASAGAGGAAAAAPAAGAGESRKER